MIECIFTKEEHWLTKWDHYLQTNDRGSHLILSDWLKSYAAYNFDFEVCIVLHKDEIVGGFGAVIAKVLFLKFYVIPYGPIVSVGFEKELNSLIQQVVSRATFHNSCYCHITLPLAPNENSHVMVNIPSLEILTTAATGHLFHHVYSSNGLNWVDLGGFEIESKLNSFKPSVRRNIRNSFRKGLDYTELNTPEKIYEGYQLFIENSRISNYSIREWAQIKNTLIVLLEKGFLKMLGVYKDNELKGAILLLKSGNYFTYVLGGSKKEKPDLRTGDFLHWEAIKISFEKGFDGYNISLGGSKGVLEFKNSFNTEQILFESSKYHWILNPFYFKIYSFFKVFLKMHKKKIAKILTRIRS